jgi:hypothetical protein
MAIVTVSVPLVVHLYLSRQLLFERFRNAAIASIFLDDILFLVNFLWDSDRMLTNQVGKNQKCTASAWSLEVAWKLRDSRHLVPLCDRRPGALRRSYKGMFESKIGNSAGEK